SAVNMQPNNQKSPQVVFLTARLVACMKSGGERVVGRSWPEDEKQLITAQNLCQYYWHKNTACGELGSAYRDVSQW
ncbi:MAG: hypothetical protein K6G72_02410, partial [Lachnospiraceae bacterium]|nr:hypothetical protein [Lachnospiraceae bacterium]